MCPTSHPSQRHACLQTGPGGLMPKSHSASASRGYVRPRQGWWKWGKVERRRGVTKEMGRFRGPRMESHLHASRLRPSLSAAPLSALSFLCFTHSTYPPPPRNGPHGFSHHIANMQSFLWFKKKVIISRNNMKID